MKKPFQNESSTFQILFDDSTMHTWKKKNDIALKRVNSGKKPNDYVQCYSHFEFTNGTVIFPWNSTDRSDRREHELKIGYFHGFEQLLAVK